MRDALIDTMKGAGQAGELCTFPDGTEVLVLAHGGRILGLFAPGSSRNLLWTNPALDSAATARAFFGSEQWHNSGGDRTWLAPEVDFFFPDYPDMKRYWQPRQLDPGAYRLSQTEFGVSLTNRLAARLSRSREEVDLTIVKTVSPAADPLRHEHLITASGIAYAGYTLRTSLEWNSERAGTSPVGLWNLLQLPHGGELLIPTHGRTQPRAYFGTIPDDDLHAGDDLVRYRMRASGEQKIGIRAAAATGRMAYRHQTADGHWELVVRNVFVNPSGHYVDIPWNGPAEPGDALQACNVRSGLGQFSEMEYHVPALGPGTGLFFVEDVSQVWAYRGTREQIVDVTRALVTAECSS
ncbi:MAG: DUF6786 family protein [Isosphaeraceae bacterium]